MYMLKEIKKFDMTEEKMTKYFCSKTHRINKNKNV